MSYVPVIQQSHDKIRNVLSGENRDETIMTGICFNFSQFKPRKGAAAATQVVAARQ